SSPTPFLDMTLSAPAPTRFPYTTLFRSRPSLLPDHRRRRRFWCDRFRPAPTCLQGPPAPAGGDGRRVGGPVPTDPAPSPYIRLPVCDPVHRPFGPHGASTIQTGNRR